MIHISTQSHPLQGSVEGFEFECVRLIFECHLRVEHDNVLLEAVFPIKHCQRRQFEIFWGCSIQDFGTEGYNVLNLYPFLEYVISSLLLDYLDSCLQYLIMVT